MNRTNNRDGRIAGITFASVYPHYLAKVEKKGRTKKELHQVIWWMTGFDEEIENPLTQKVRYLDKLVDELAKVAPWRRSCGQRRNLKTLPAGEHAL